MLITLDVEASSLKNESYPIQIGFTKMVDSKFVTTEFMIKPIPEWTDWDEETELYIHNISRRDIENDGLDIYHCCKMLNTQLSGHIVIVDSEDFDNFWINKLYDAANMKRDFQLINIEKYLYQHKGVTNSTYEDERENYSFSHQAGEDSVMIMQILTSLINNNPA